MPPELIAGIHEDVRKKRDIFLKEELELLTVFARYWFVTRAGQISLGNSQYRFLLVKPLEAFREAFNLEREIICIFSDYENFEPRTLDAFDSARKVINEQLRIDKICGVLVSRDKNINHKIKVLLRSDEESQVIIPFTYQEINTLPDMESMKNRFVTYFYSRDLFAFQGPLKKDLYFFGRTDIVHQIVNRHKSNENSGLFGLRRSGKTSVIYGVERALAKEDAISIFIDCQDTGFHVNRWYEALYYILKKLVEKYELNVRLPHESKFDEKRASEVFREEFRKITRVLGDKKVLLIFDEIENITFGISVSKHWREENDFILFWQTLRSIYNTSENLFTFLVVGTNPMCIETASVNGYDNPIFLGAQTQYIRNFDLAQTTEMVSRLGRTMGLRFNETIFAKLTEDFGGHPFLIRMCCSIIHQSMSEIRPITVTRQDYETAKIKFYNEYGKYIQMILVVLESFYKDELDMLTFLAQGDTENFYRFANDNPSLTNHLLGYGLLSLERGTYDFKIDLVKKYITDKLDYPKIASTMEEKRTEISQRRNVIEGKLKLLVQRALKMRYGEVQAKSKVLQNMKDRNKYPNEDYKSLFNPSRCNLYFDEIRIIIEQNWEAFEHTFSLEKRQFSLNMQMINTYRIDAHNADIDNHQFDAVRNCLKSIENDLDQM